MMSIDEFLQVHTPVGSAWMDTHAATLEDVWRDAPADLLVWVATRTGVLLEREHRQFACQCARRVWHFMPDADARRAVQTAEKSLRWTRHFPGDFAAAAAGCGWREEEISRAQSTARLVADATVHKVAALAAYAAADLAATVEAYAAVDITAAVAEDAYQAAYAAATAWQAATLRTTYCPRFELPRGFAVNHVTALRLAEARALDARDRALERASRA